MYVIIRLIKIKGNVVQRLEHSSYEAETWVQLPALLSFLFLLVKYSIVSYNYLNNFDKHRRLYKYYCQVYFEYLEYDF